MAVHDPRLVARKCQTRALPWSYQ